MDVPLLVLSILICIDFTNKARLSVLWKRKHSPTIFYDYTLRLMRFHFVIVNNYDTDSADTTINTTWSIIITIIIFGD